MYLAAAAAGFILIIVGCLMPHKSKNIECLITEKDENSISDEPSSPDTFSLELLEKQAELANKRIDILNERVLELEKKAQMSINDIPKHSDANTEEPADNNSINMENNLSTSNKDGHGSVKDINSIIYNMYDNGASLDEISSTLRIGRGELQLRLGLRKSQI